MNTAVKPDTGPAIEAAILRAEEAFSAANPLSRAQHERAVKIMPGGLSNQRLFHSPFPLSFSGGKEARIVDVDGHEYLSLVGDHAAGVYGFSCAPIQRAVRETVQSEALSGGSNAIEIELAETISQRIPSMERVRFCGSGPEAILWTAQLARQATGRPKLMVFNGCYHGGFMSYGSAATPLSLPFPVLVGTYNDVAGTRELLRAVGGDLAAVFVEPVMGFGGAIPASTEFLKMVREETRRLGIVLVFDELMSAQLAPGAVQGLRGIHPDLTALGKFWGAGYSLGAFGGLRELMQHVEPSAGGLFSQCGNNNTLVAMAAGLVGIRDVYTHAACIRLNSLGDSVRLQLNALGRSLGIGFQAMGLGGVLNVHWNDAPLTEPSQVEPAASPLRRLFQLEMLARGFFVAQRGMITLSLPMTDTDIRDFVGAVREYLVRNADILPRARTF